VARSNDHRYGFRQVKIALVANQRPRHLVRVRPRARRLLVAALLRGGHPWVTLRLRATDSAGNCSALARSRLLNHERASCFVPESLLL
jgi:hypothetical protein